MTHLSSADLAAEIERLIDPARPPEDRDARIADHLEACEVCRERLRVLHAQDMMLASLLTAPTHTPPASEVSSETRAHVAAMMKRLREDAPSQRGERERHLGTLALAGLLEVDEGIASPDEDDAAAREHLTQCTLCRERLAALRAQDHEVARALMSAAAASPPRQVKAGVPIDPSVIRFAEEAMQRLRNDVEVANHPRSRSRWSTSANRLLGFAAGVGFALLVPALRSSSTTSAPGTVAMISAGQQTLRDSVAGFTDKVYVQQVSAGSRVHFSVEGLDALGDFDCELYDAKHVAPVAMEVGIKNSCTFSLVTAAAGEYRLVVKNRYGAPRSYKMVTEALHEVPPVAP